VFNKSTISQITYQSYVHILKIQTIFETIFENNGKYFKNPHK